MDPLLRVEGLRISYRERDRLVKAVGGVDLALAPGEILALVGESGSGKTTLALGVLGLLPGNAQVEGGNVWFEGRDLRRLNPDELRQVRGRRISMIFQDPVSGLNPVLTIGAQVAEIVETHLSVPRKEARRITLEALRAQGLAQAERTASSYPFQLSGGMCQRVMIAIATVLRPDVIIADEPTSSLDVTLQAAILAELVELRQRTGTAIMLITHDLGVVATVADTMAVMYAGRIVEQGTTVELFARPLHPYTAGLLASRPRLDDPERGLRPIPGSSPDPAAPGEECAFLPRCSKATSACRTEPWPHLQGDDRRQKVACFNPLYHAPD